MSKTVLATRFRHTIKELMESVLNAFPRNTTLTTFKFLLDNASDSALADMPADFYSFTSEWEDYINDHDEIFFLDLDAQSIPFLLRTPFIEVKSLYKQMTEENRQIIWAYIDHLMLIAKAFDRKSARHN